MTIRSIRQEKELLRHRFVEFQVKIAELSKMIADQQDAFKLRENEMLSTLFEVLDAFDNLHKVYDEKADDLDKTSKKLLKSQRAVADKIRRMLKERHIIPIAFPDGKARMDLCKIVDTKPMPDGENEQIVDVEKTGYIDTEQNRVLRKAEVITVLNDYSRSGKAAT